MGDDKSRAKSTVKKYKSRNPFINFMEDFRKENSHLLSKELFKLAGERWKQMSPEEKAPYINAAKEAEKITKKKKRHSTRKDSDHSKRRFRRRGCCSRCGHRASAACESTRPKDSLESVWDTSVYDKSSRGGSKTSSRSRSRSRSETSNSAEDSEYYASDVSSY